MYLIILVRPMQFELLDRLVVVMSIAERCSAYIYFAFTVTL